MTIRYSQLSHAPNHELDRDTGELTPLARERNRVGNKVQEIVDEKLQKNIHLARQVSGAVGEKIAKILLRKMIQVGTTSEFDILLEAELECEVKASLIGGKCVIKESQLDMLPHNGFYILVYYTINGFDKGSRAIAYAEKNLKTNPTKYLMGKIKITDIFIFPKPDIVFMYNDTKKTPYPIRDNKKGQPIQKYIGVGIRTARNHFYTNPAKRNASSFTLINPMGNGNKILTHVLDLDVRL